MTIWVYSISPIDWWHGWHKPNDFFGVYSDEMEAIDGPPDAREFYAIWDRARELAKKLHWEGDIRPGGNGPFVIPIPTDEPGVPAFAIAWKQDNNGSTFVASTVALPHLVDEGGENWMKG
jgi:hypothetical protein